MSAVPNPLVAQVPSRGDCETGDAEEFLDVGNVRAKVLNTGALFWNGGENVYEVPKGSGNSSIFTSVFLITGLVDGELRAAASTYGGYELWPGPIPDGDIPPTDCGRFDRIYEIRSSGQTSSGAVSGIAGDTRDWPVHLGAPYVEVGGSPDSYDPEDGDYPELLGDQTLWWVTNDLGNAHDRTDTQPLGVEVRGTAFAFNAVSGLENQTFYRYRIRNRTNRDIRSAYVGLYTDVDLGRAFDDYVGSDSTHGVAYFYNADDDDEGSYGAAPPAVGFTVLRRPISSIDSATPECSYPDGGTHGLTNHMHYFGGGGPTGDPGTGQEFRNLMQSRWKDGTPLMIGGTGYRGSGPEVDFVYPGDPVTGAYWSEVNSDGEGTARPPADRRSISSVGPFCLGPGDEAEVVFAVIWARGRTNLDSVTRLRAIGEGMQEIAGDLLRPRRLETPESESPDVMLLAASLYPNPAIGDVTIRLAVPQPMDVHIEVVDALGRQAAHIESGMLPEAVHTYERSVAHWPPGVYLVRFMLDHITETRTLVVTR